MGPQSSGKSTLLNHLFGTNFGEMDAFKGSNLLLIFSWYMVSKMCYSASIEPCTLVMDLEGTDRRERGEDDTAFEKQSALFALAVSDIVLINMWCHDIGREQAANKPLLKTVFQVIHVYTIGKFRTGSKKRYSEGIRYGILFLSHKKIRQSCQSNEDQIPSKEDVSWRTELLETRSHPKILGDDIAKVM
ncbi:hypothetical protein Pint_11139 [Pistacia integerrima]|uniref:Uncharacterized protein n=1 Tax=Pistacia integerrima TaxID=434235 RepID=A0ACC0XKR4_9ROSI|nr:hypothetical protein Pint_11139 [Pistacia integerrima]